MFFRAQLGGEKTLLRLNKLFGTSLTDGHDVDRACVLLSCRRGRRPGVAAYTCMWSHSRIGEVITKACPVFWTCWYLGYTSRHIAPSLLVRWSTKEWKLASTHNVPTPDERTCWTHSSFQPNFTFGEEGGGACPFNLWNMQSERPREPANVTNQPLPPPPLLESFQDGKLNNNNALLPLTSFTRLPMRRLGEAS